MRQACSHSTLTRLETADEDELGVPQKPDVAQAKGKTVVLPNIQLQEEGGDTERTRVVGKQGQLLQASTKITQIIEILRDIRKDGDKTIVFSQFTSFFEILEPFLAEAGFKFVRCECFSRPPSRKFTNCRFINADDGTLSAKNKEKVLDQIRNDNKITVLLLR